MNNTNPNEIADTIENLVQDAIDKVVNRTFKRGIVAARNPPYANVYIEGNTVATKNIVCLAHYDPQIGHKVLIVSIGDTGSNLVILGKLN